MGAFCGMAFPRGSCHLVTSALFVLFAHLAPQRVHESSGCQRVVLGGNETQQPTALASLGDAELLALRTVWRKLCGAGDKHTWPGSNWRPLAGWAAVVATRPQALAKAQARSFSQVAVVTLPTRFRRQPRKHRSWELDLTDATTRATTT
jgi:hypothetical protein